ncbi:type VI secretion system baseplate subunit TssK [Legionella spiritensis]|uniref:type VI secretion system baseplate subunit TssK n=1 Tax=Legionella spiritensis TaxID=452 RepID=UPI000F6EAAD3|nr:type VI secretion system baseplate subunit TssK [Legionella spiritensis]VEG90612.1 Uncharacterized protein conserved in bacteria [Legionella spiritensis]
MWTKPIDWQHGLFLQPQHFQCTEFNQHFQQSSYLKLQTPYFWGISRLVADQLAISNGRFDVEELSFVLPTGEFIQINANAKFLPRSFINDWPANQDRLKVYIGVKDLLKNQRNVTVVENPEQLSQITTRYISFNDGNELPDFYHQGSQTQLNSLFFVVKLFWDFELEDSHNYRLIQIAELHRKDNKIYLSDSYIPPSVVVEASSNLQSLLNEISRELTQIGSELEKFKFPIDWYNSQIDKANFGRLFSLRTILRYVPLLKHYLGGDAIHPWFIYSVLQQLIGELSYFSMDVSMFTENAATLRALPEYNHNDLTASFSTAKSLIMQLLYTISTDPGRLARMQREKNYYVATLNPRFINTGRDYYVVVYAENNQDVVKQLIEASGKLCAYSQIEEYIEYALPGAEMKLLVTAPDGVPKGASCLYYKIDKNSSMWRNIEKELKAAFYVGKTPIDLTIDLVAVGV